MTDKKGLRQHYREKRTSLSETYQKSASDAICQKIIKQIPTVQAADNLAFYLSQDGEIDLMPLMHHCLNQGKTCFLPVLDKSEANALLFAPWSPSQKMINNKYGIPEPDVGQDRLRTACQMGLLFMPLVAFDQFGNRLGMGGGYYDRTLAKCYKLQSDKPPFVVATGHDIQYSSKLPSDEWDIMPDITLSPGKFILSDKHSDTIFK